MIKYFPIILALLLCVWTASADVIVHLDVSETPELAEWGDNAKKLVEQWHQRTVNMIPTKNFDVPAEIWLKIRKSDKGIAYTSNDHITVSSGWVEKHPEDIGLVFHEMVHVIQNYGRNNAPGWIVEGIADYLRWAIYEAKDQDWFPLENSSKGYEASYRVTAGFFLWLESDRCPGIVNTLNTAIRKNEFEDIGFFKKQTGNTIDELWADYLNDKMKKAEKQG